MSCLTSSLHFFCVPSLSLLLSSKIQSLRFMLRYLLPFPLSTTTLPSLCNLSVKPPLLIWKSTLQHLPRWNTKHVGVQGTPDHCLTCYQMLVAPAWTFIRAFTSATSVATVSASKCWKMTCFISEKAAFPLPGLTSAFPCRQKNVSGDCGFWKRV